MILSSFPRIPHLPGSHASADDLVCDDAMAARFLRRRVHVFEKLDGLNVTINRVGRGRIVYALKSEWKRTLGRGVARGLEIWIAQREAALHDLLDVGVLYGEWVRHTLHVPYRGLPDFFLPFAMWRHEGGFMPYRAFAAVCAAQGLFPVEPLFSGRLSNMAAVRALVTRSRYGKDRMEGVIVEDASDPSDDRWAKWVDPRYQHPVKGHLGGALNAVSLPGAI